jgi:small conductance mechanosensitive channel
MVERMNGFFSISVGPLTVGNLLQAAAAVLAGILLSRVAVKWVGRALKRSRVERSLHTFIKSTISTVLYLITALIVADSLGIPITSLVALISVVGLAVSLSVQNTLMNLFGGLLVLATKPFAVGDYIAASDAEGTVLDIGLIYTKMATFDGKTVFLPNGVLSSGRITNYTQSQKRRLDMEFSTTADADPEAVKALLMQALEDERVIKDPPPMARVSGYSDKGISYVLRTWVATADYWNLMFDLNERVGRAFRQSGINMPGRRYEIDLRREKPGS